MSKEPKPLDIVVPIIIFPTKESCDDNTDEFGNTIISKSLAIIHPQLYTSLKKAIESDMKKAETPDPNKGGLN